MDTMIRRRMMMELGGTPTPPTPPLPDGQLEWLATDGSAWISTGMAAACPKSFEMKVLVRTGATTNRVFVGVFNPSSTGRYFSPLIISASQTTANVGYYYYYGAGDGTPSIADSLTNGTPFEVRTKFDSRSQFIEVKQEGESVFTRKSIQSSLNPSTSGYNMQVFRGNPAGGSTISACIEGDRIYFLKIYSDANFSTLVKHYIPWRKNGEVVFYESISQTFISPSSGVFFGGPNIN